MCVGFLYHYDFCKHPFITDRLIRPCISARSTTDICADIAKRNVILDEPYCENCLAEGEAITAASGERADDFGLSIDEPLSREELLDNLQHIDYWRQQEREEHQRSLQQAGNDQEWIGQINADFAAIHERMDQSFENLETELRQLHLTEAEEEEVKRLENDSSVDKEGVCEITEDGKSYYGYLIQWPGIEAWITDGNDDHFVEKIQHLY